MIERFYEKEIKIFFGNIVGLKLIKEKVKYLLFRGNRE